MELYNPYESKKSPKQGKSDSTEIDYFIGACVWEALRHNSDFCNTVECSKNDRSRLIDTITNRSDHFEDTRLGFFAVNYIVDPSVMTLFSELKIETNVTPPSLEIPWPDIDPQFKKCFSKLCTLFLGKNYQSKYGEGVEADLNFGEDLFNLCIDDQSNPEEILEKLRGVLSLLKGHIFRLPDGQYSVAQISKIIKQVENHFKKLNKAHGNQRILPKKKDWDCYLTYKKSRLVGDSHNEAYSMVLYQHDRGKWKKFIQNACFIEIPDNPEEAFPYVDESIKAWKMENIMPLRKSIDNVTEFSNWLWPSPEKH